MSILERLANPQEWKRYYQYKEEAKNLSKEQLKELYEFIEKQEYESAIRSVLTGDSFAAPHKICLNKLHSNKKRIVYTYKKEENYVLKLVTFLLKEYDFLFADNLYSFRKNKGVKDAIDKIMAVPELNQFYTYKVDISNYFNSVNTDIMISILKNELREDAPLCNFLESLLRNPYVYEEGVLKKEEKGIMAGTPISTFLANLYLKELDEWFAQRNRLYARYSDDIIVFARTEEELEEDIAVIGEILGQYGLFINQKKEIKTAPGEKWSFLGFSYQDGKIDVSDISVEKIKNKMRRKVRALKRWQRKNQVTGEKAALAFIRHFNRKFFENRRNHELTWTRWYFPVITDIDGLQIIDHYMQDQIRYLATGKRTKARYLMRYEEMKKLGYKSLVHEYYDMKSAQNQVLKF